MEALLWRGVLVVLCTPAMLTCPGGPACPVVQSPGALSLNGANSSAEILCSTTRPNPMGLSLHGRFHGSRMVAYLSMLDGAVTRTTVEAQFRGRLAVVAQPKDERCCSVALRLSRISVEDTDIYSCTWTYLDINTFSVLKFKSKGTVIIVRERGSNNPCSTGFALDLTLIVLSLVAFVVAFFVFIGAVVWKCSKRRKRFTCGRGTRESRRPHQYNMECPVYIPQPLSDIPSPPQDQYLMRS